LSHGTIGYSGGPVVFQFPGEKDIKVVGVISGYRKADETPRDLSINSGIIIAYDINYAVELIKANPIGFTIP